MEESVVQGSRMTSALKKDVKRQSAEEPPVSIEPKPREISSI